MPDLYKSKIPIVRNDLNEGFMRGHPGDQYAVCGTVPRDYNEDPVAVGDSASGLQLYKESEWDALYDAGELYQDSLEHILLRGIESGAIEYLDQGEFPDCWCHSVAHAWMVNQLYQTGKTPRINAVAMATLMRRTNGGWAGLALKFGREHGMPVVGTGPGQWPYQSRAGHDTPELRADMERHRILEDWYDLGRAAWDQKLSRDQLATCLFDGCPCPSDYNRAGHSMLSLRKVRYEPGAWGTLTWNSWRSFGYHGLCVLDDSWVPDNAVCLRVGNPAPR